MDDRRVIFVRHKLDPDTVRMLWDNQLIAIQFKNTSSIHPEGYDEPSARSAIKHLRMYCEEGVIVAASYRPYKPSTLLVGTIGPLDPDEAIKPIEWKGYFNKTVHIEDAIEVHYRDYPILAAVQPTGGTISKWHLGQKVLRSIINKEPLEWSVGSLDPGQLEVLCCEYLRATGEIESLLLPIGRNLQDVDIYGIRAGGSLTAAQVTHSSSDKQIKDKVKRLQEFDDPNISLFFFGPRNAQSELERFSIRYVPIEDVFDYLSSAEPDSAYRYMIEQMLRRHHS